MTRNEHLLSILAEECVEVAQRATKALRFGLAEIQPGQLKTNAQRIIDEMNDLLAAYQMITSENLPLFKGSPFEWHMALENKKEKIEKFLKYSAECGTVSNHEELRVENASLRKLLERWHVAYGAPLEQCEEMAEASKTK